MQCIGGLVVSDEYKCRSVRCADEVGKIEGTCGRSESGHTSPTRAGREMTTYTLKDWRTFEVRDQLADERKNHAVSSVALPA
jgi:hypothetical protein